jgi:hypothetical protein
LRPCDGKNNYKKKEVYCVTTHFDLYTIMASNRKKNDDHNRMPLSTIPGPNTTKTNLHQTCDIRLFKKQHPFLSQLLRDDGILFECDGEAPSPSKDYGQLQITMDKVYYLI